MLEVSNFILKFLEKYWLESLICGLISCLVYFVVFTLVVNKLLKRLKLCSGYRIIADFVWIGCCVIIISATFLLWCQTLLLLAILLIFLSANLLIPSVVTVIKNAKKYRITHNKYLVLFLIKIFLILLALYGWFMYTVITGTLPIGWKFILPISFSYFFAFFPLYDSISVLSPKARLAAHENGNIVGYYVNVRRLKWDYFPVPYSTPVQKIVTF